MALAIPARIAFFLIAIGSTFVLHTSALAKPQRYNFTTLLPPTAVGSEAYGVNDVGEIVGWSLSPTIAFGGFVFDGTGYTEFIIGSAPAGLNNTQALGINAAGQIVGTVVDFAGQRGFLKDGANIDTFAAPGSTATLATGINNLEEIVGTFVSAIGSALHGFIFNGTTFATIDVPGALHTLAWGINDRGQIVGWFTDSDSREHGFVFEGGVFTTFDVPGATTLTARGIDACGRVVGTFIDTQGVAHGYLKDGKKFTTIDVPAAGGTWVNGVSPTTGQIVGRGADFAGTGVFSRGFVATPAHGRGSHCHDPKQ